MQQKECVKNIEPYDGVATKSNEVSTECIESCAKEVTRDWFDKELERPISIKDRYQRIAATDAFKEAYVDRDIGEILEIKEDL